MFNQPLCHLDLTRVTHLKLGTRFRQLLPVLSETQWENLESPHKPKTRMGIR